jgi:hypothetical protein
VSFVESSGSNCVAKPWREYLTCPLFLTTTAESDFTDQPSTRIALDRFKRPRHEYVTPAGGSEVEVARNDYYDVVPPRESRSARPAV